MTPHTGFLFLGSPYTFCTSADGAGSAQSKHPANPPSSLPNFSLVQPCPPVPLSTISNLDSLPRPVLLPRGSPAPIQPRSALQPCLSHCAPSQPRPSLCPSPAHPRCPQLRSRTRCPLCPPRSRAAPCYLSARRSPPHILPCHHSPAPPSAPLSPILPRQHPPGSAPCPAPGTARAPPATAPRPSLAPRPRPRPAPAPPLLPGGRALELEREGLLDDAVVDLEQDHVGAGSGSEGAEPAARTGDPPEPAPPLPLSRPRVTSASAPPHAQAPPRPAFATPTSGDVIAAPPRVGVSLNSGGQSGDRRVLVVWGYGVCLGCGSPDSLRCPPPR